MKTFINRWPVAAGIGLALGVLLGSVVALAMGRNGHMYTRFVGFTFVVAIVAVGVWACQTYLRPKGAHVEETDTEVSA